MFAEQMEMQFPSAINRDFTERYREYAKWLKDNPSIYTAFKRNALRLIGMGRLHYGARALAEGIRLQTYLRDTDYDYKLNNNLSLFCRVTSL